MNQMPRSAISAAVLSVLLAAASVGCSKAANSSDAVPTKTGTSFQQHSSAMLAATPASGASSPIQGIMSSASESKTAPGVPESKTPAFANETTGAHAPDTKNLGLSSNPMATSAKGNVKYNAGEDPEYAKKKGWPVKYPNQSGSIVPSKRIVAYYGNPLSKRMGALGEYQKADMLRRLKSEAAKWEKADPSHPVQPALHLIAVVAQGEPGKAGKYRMIMPDKVINEVYGWAKEAGAILFIDVQTGHDNIRNILPRFEWILKNPDVHLGIDPEFNLVGSGKRPGTKIGTYDAADINYASNYLANLVNKYHLPPKTFVVHRFTRNGVTRYKKIALRPEVQIVMNMDGWGAPWLKRDSYRDYVVAEPVQYTGFKLFYHNDTKKGDALLTPKEVLKLNPQPIYIQYQ